MHLVRFYCLPGSVNSPLVIPDVSSMRRNVVVQGGRAHMHANVNIVLEPQTNCIFFASPKSKKIQKRRQLCLFVRSGGQLKTWATKTKADLEPISGPRVFGHARWRKDWVKVSSELAQDRRDVVNAIGDAGSTRPG